MNPAVVLGMQVASSVAGGISALGRARAERRQAENNAYIGETRGLQTAAALQQEMGSELATLRATLASNGTGLDSGTMPFLRELRRVRMREGRIGIGNERQQAADWRMQGRNAMAAGRAQFMSSLFGAGPSLFDLYQLRQGPQTSQIRPQARPW